MWHKHILFISIANRGMVPQNEMLTRKMFCKDPFLERKIFNPSSGDSKPEDVKKTWLSFWDWLWCCLKLLAWVPPHVSQSLRKLWREDRIVGFMSEAEIKHVLAAATQVKPGTFIIRFPERKADCIGLYWYNPSGNAYRNGGLNHIVNYGNEWYFIIICIMYRKCEWRGSL